MDRLAQFREILRPLRPGKLVDLGTGHGKFAMVADGLGWQVTGVDARTQRLPESNTIEWVHSDVRGFPLDGYDCICVLGLFYHLTVDDQLALLGRATALTIIDTHLAQRSTHSEQGYAGRTFEEKHEAPTSSWQNAQSFWPTEDSFLRMLADTGFGPVFKSVPSYQVDRTFWICHRGRD